MTDASSTDTRTEAPLAQPSAIEAGFAALIVALRAAAMDSEERGQGEAAERAARYRAMIISVRDRWTSGEASPARARGAKAEA